jgi:hypothetical protein
VRTIPERWRALAPEQRQAAAAAVALALCMLLPWYSLTGARAEKSVSAFSVFSFVEAAVLVVAAAVLYLLWARSEGRAFHLPGGDGWAITAGGAWVEFLLVWRLFDKPDEEQFLVGVTWGIFVTMAVAALLIGAGQRLRAAHRPEPPNPAEDPTWEMPGGRRRRATDRERRPADSTAVTEALRTRPPAWEGEPPEAPGRAQRVVAPDVHDLAWETPPLWGDESDAVTRQLPREEPHADEDEAPEPPPPPGSERLF